MLTQTVMGRVYDYSHAVGGLYIPQTVGIAIGEGDTVYALSRPADAISGAISGGMSGGMLADAASGESTAAAAAACARWMAWGRSRATAWARRMPLG